MACLLLAFSVYRFDMGLSTHVAMTRAEIPIIQLTGVTVAGCRANKLAVVKDHARWLSNILKKLFVE